MEISKTKHHSWCSGQLSEGCQKCVQGRKVVLFITGICPQKCFYCPVSEHKFGHDVVYANEWKIEDPENPVELLEEAKLAQATGAGITGGDPLANVERCCKYIRMLKEKFGIRFHTHLYTSLMLVTKERLQKLFDAGLDEIRFHPDLDDNKLWDNLKLAKEFGWKTGVEIPSIPGYEEKTKKLIDFIADKVDFLNLNELELSDTEIPHFKLREKGFKPKDNISYGVAGSEQMALKMMEYAKSKNLPVHFCTAKLKDRVQVGNRLKLRAQSVALQYDLITEEGLLIRGCIYLPDTAPASKIPKQENVTGRLKDAIEKLNFLKQDKTVVDEKKGRLIIPKSHAKQFSKQIKKAGLVPAIVEEYPTVDGLEVDVEFL